LPYFSDGVNELNDKFNMETDLEKIVGKEPLREINKMTPNSKVSALRKISEQMPNGPELAVLQRHIVNLMSEQRSSLDFAAPIVAPNLYDVLILDITSADLNKIGEELESIPLSETSVTPSFPVKGILFGQAQRMFLPLIVSKRSKSINVNFLFDTASPNTYLRQETLAALGFVESTPTETNVIIHGTAMTIYLSSNHFENVDLLGQDYMTAIRGVVGIDYPLREIVVNVK
jgi:hypothetical protein